MQRRAAPTELGLLGALLEHEFEVLELPLLAHVFLNVERDFGGLKRALKDVWAKRR